MIQSLILSFLLGGIIVLTFALVDEKIYQEHQFAFIFLLSTFVLLFESLLVFLDVTLFSNIRLSDLNMLLWPVYLYPYYHYANRTNRLCAIFYSFFTYFSGWRNSNFSDDNCLFSVGRCFSSSLLDCLQYVYSFAFFRNHLKLIDLFELIHFLLWEEFENI